MAQCSLRNTGLPGGPPTVGPRFGESVINGGHILVYCGLSTPPVFPSKKEGIGLRGATSAMTDPDVRRQRSHPTTRPHLVVATSVRVLGRGLPGRVVRPSHALAHRADEEGRPYVASPSTADLELVSRARRDFRGHRGGLQQQSETDHQKGVRLSLVSMPGNRSVPYTRSATGVRNYPQILLKTREFFRKMARPAGFEPATLGLEGHRSTGGPPTVGPRFGESVINGGHILVYCGLSTPPVFPSKKEGIGLRGATSAMTDPDVRRQRSHPTTRPHLVVATSVRVSD